MSTNIYSGEVKAPKKEKKNGFRNMLRIIHRSFFLCLRLVPKLTVQLILVTVALQFFPLIQNGLFGNIINQITEILTKSAAGAGASAASTNLISSILTLILMYVGVLVLSAIFEEIKKFVEKRWDLTLDNRLGTYSMRKRAGIDIAHYEDPDFQNLMYKAFENSTWPIYTLAKGQVQNIASIFGIVTAGAIVYNISPALLIISICAAIPNFIVEIRYGSTMWGIWAENSPRQRLFYALRSHVHDRKNVVQTKMLQATEKILSITERIMGAFLKDQLKVDKRRLWLGISASVIMSLGIGYGIYLIIGEVISGTVLPGTLVFAVTSLQSLVTTMNYFLRDLAEQYKRFLTARDMFEVYDTAPKIREVAEPKPLSLDKAPKIEFKNVSFKYPSKDIEKAPWVFKDLNFTIESGQKLGLVGANGAGKSTLIKLLMRVYDPTEGSILVNGEDLRNVSISNWTSLLSVLLQQYSLHEFSVEDAIAMGLPDRETDSAKAMEAAKQSGADEFIQEYPKKYDQLVSREFEDGIEPSQGQLQKIALARALYRLQVSQILVLDEPTAAIDPLAELEIFEQMEKAAAGKTLILITHRFNSVKNVDKIVVLDGHKLVEQGSHEELMRKHGVYAAMFEGQAKGFRE